MFNKSDYNLNKTDPEAIACEPQISLFGKLLTSLHTKAPRILPGSLDF